MAKCLSRPMIEGFGDVCNHVGSRVEIHLSHDG